MLLTLQNKDIKTNFRGEDGVDSVGEIQNPGAFEVLIALFLHFSTKLQLKIQTRLERLARVGARNQDALTSYGCVVLLLEAMQILVGNASSLIINVLQVVEVLGEYRQTREISGGFLGRRILEMFDRMSLSGTSSESVSMSPYLQLYPHLNLWNLLVPVSVRPELPILCIQILILLNTNQDCMMMTRPRLWIHLLTSLVFLVMKKSCGQY